MANVINFYRRKSTTRLMQDLEDNEISINYHNRSIKNEVEIVNSLKENNELIKKALKERGLNV